MNNEVQLNLEIIKQRLANLEMEIVIRDCQIEEMRNQIDGLNIELSSKETYIESLEKGGGADVESK